MTILEVKDLKIYFRSPQGIAQAVDGISFSLEKGKTTALVGESGCGKTITGYAIMGLVPEPNGFIAGGQILYNNQDLLKLSFNQMRKLRGKTMAMIFQEPATALNPVFTIGSQLAETLRIHQEKAQAVSVNIKKRCIDILAEVGIPEPALRFDEYPHQLSGGMKQRVMIAMALITNPDILIADEPTTALDVTIQAQIIELLKSVQEKFGTALLLITHDLGVVAENADNITIMYAGKIVEQGDIRTIIDNPSHPYTQGLLKSLPSMNKSGQKLYSIKGVVPQALDFPAGCRFRTRCPEAQEQCAQQPKLKTLDNNIKCACFFRN